MESKMNAASFGDRERMEDALISQKHVTGLYNTFLDESTGVEVRSCLSNILNEEHDIQSGIYYRMTQKGWYQNEQAEDAKVNRAKQQFSSKA